MEELLAKSSQIESNDDFTTTENRFDPDLVKQGYYYLLSLPYKKPGMKKVVPQDDDTLNSSEYNFIETAKELFEKTCETQKLTEMDQMTTLIMDLA